MSNEVNFAGIMLSFFLILYFLFKPERQTHDLIASALLVVFAAFLSAPWIHDTGWHFLFIVPPTLPFLVGPVLLLFVESLISASFRLKPFDLVHFAVPFSVYIYIAFFAHSIPGAPGYPPVEGSGFHLFPGPATLLSLLGYGIASLWKIIRHRETVKSYFSFLSSQNTMRWPARLVVGYLVIVFLLIFMDVFHRRLHFALPGPPRVHSMISFLFVFFTGYLNLYARPVFSNSADKAEDSRYQKSAIEESKLKSYCHTIEEYLKEEKPYRNSEFTVLELEKAVGIPRHHISQAFSQGFETNFYNYVNQLRVEEVISSLQNKKYREHSLLRIGLESGFNSKSSFNRIFKQWTGKTPSEYRSAL